MTLAGAKVVAKGDTAYATTTGVIVRKEQALFLAHDTSESNSGKVRKSAWLDDNVVAMIPNFFTVAKEGSDLGPLTIGGQVASVSMMRSEATGCITDASIVQGALLPFSKPIEEAVA